MAGMLGVGRFVDKVGTRIGYMIIMAVWSVSAMGHALANTVLQFGIARACLGLGESGNFPAAIKTVAEWFPQNERSLATGIFNSGANVGAIIAPIAVPWVAVRYGWHAAFLLTGVFSASWIVLWFFTYSSPTESKKLTATELNYIEERTAPLAGVPQEIYEAMPATPWLKLLTFRQTWAFALGKFITDPVWWFYLFWMPKYFSSKFNVDLAHLWLPLFIVYNVSTVGSVTGGWLPRPFRKMGLSQGNSRLAAMLLCACMVVPILLANYTHSEWVAIALFSLAAGAHQGWSANIFTTVSDMFPRSEVGSVTGIGGMAGSLGGFLIALFAGHVLQATGSYFMLIVIASGAYLVALAVIVTLAPGLKKAEIYA
jgi:ACS family hexuronate transporter-like MFS transporter